MHFAARTGSAGGHYAEAHGGWRRKSDWKSDWIKGSRWCTPIPSRVLEVLINLVDNAIKFTQQDGSVVIKACMVEADPGSVYISVSDTGRGIGPEAKALIFERLYQDPDSVDNSRSGLGLGLFICQRNRAPASGTHLGFERTGTGQHLHLHSARILPGQAACPGHHA